MDWGRRRAVISFKRRVAELGFSPGKRVCPACKTEYPFYKGTADVGPELASMECEKCRELVWYYPENDLTLDRHFGFSPHGLPSSEILAKLRAMNGKIETIVSPCPCGGNYRHIDHREYGFPRYCPKCEAPQMIPEFRKEPPEPWRDERIPINLLEFYEGHKASP